MQGNALRLDPMRRLRNALFALANLDKGWMSWVEKNVPSCGDVRVAMRLVEVRARELVMGSYRYLGEAVIKQIVDGDRPFGDDGTLLQG